MRSASASASRRSWVTKSTLAPQRRHCATSIARRRFAVGLSSDTKGSSISSSAGSFTKARASATRRIMPPESRPG